MHLNCQFRNNSIIDFINFLKCLFLLQDPGFKSDLYFLRNIGRTGWCSGWSWPYPLCSQVWVESDGWVGADSSWLTGVLMSLTVYLPCTNLPFKNLSVTHRASFELLVVSSAQQWSYRYCWLNHYEGKKKKKTHSSQDLKLWSEMLTWPTPGSIKIKNPVILTQ